MSYSKIKPIVKRIPALRQAAKRHYGVHPYFTRRPYNVVRDYILHYSNPGDVILDPFGGSGVTAIEAFLENRIGVQSDINPLANFIAKGIAALPLTSEEEIISEHNKIISNCKKKIDELFVSKEIEFGKYNALLPPNVPLPRNSDVQNYYDLFSPSQLVALAVLKKQIDGIGNEIVRNLFLLIWSGILARLNKTFISAKNRAETRGGSSIFSIYRYKVAKSEVSLDLWTVFQQRFESIMTARKEMIQAIDLKKRTTGWSGEFRCYDLDVLDLEKEFTNSIDYIFTDPPYGGHISYLDLSTLWNVWLGDVPSQHVKEKELIVGGELGFSEEDYTHKLYQSIRSLFNMLKEDRWVSIVFQHWNIGYFKSILQAAEDSCSELKSAVSQIGDPIWSMHKKKGKETVLAGELILTFYKNHYTSKSSSKKKFRDYELSDTVNRFLSQYNSPVLYGEVLFNHLVIESWKNGRIDDLNISKSDLTNMLESNGWRYNSLKHAWVKQQTMEKELLNLAFPSEEDANSSANVAEETPLSSANSTPQK